MRAKIVSILDVDGSYVTVEERIGGVQVIFNARRGKYKVGDTVDVKYKGSSMEDGYTLVSPEDY